MKEIIYKIKHKEEDCKKCVYSGLCVKDLCEVEHETQVPETFEELKGLCEDLKVIKVEEDYIEIFGALIGSNMLFCQDGAIFLNTDCCFKEKATPQQMWQIIKNLIGEE